MLKIKKTIRFKTSLKKYQNNKAVMLELKKVLKHLENRELLPSKYKDHVLKGRLKNIRECHLKPNALLLYFVIENETLKLIDIGSHASVLKM